MSIGPERMSLFNKYASFTAEMLSLDNLNLQLMWLARPAMHAMTLQRKVHQMLGEHQEQLPSRSMCEPCMPS